VLDAIRRLRDHWASQPRHRYLAAADCVPTIISGGEWVVSYPARCRVDCHIEYLPGQADASGYGSLVAAEFSEWILRATETDRWLAAHPPRIDWLAGGVPPAEVDPGCAIVQAALDATGAVGRPGRIAGLDNWHDGATLTVEAGIPAICLGPGDIHLAHTSDEHVTIRDLVDCCQALAVTAMRYCGLAAD
jgi:acetylornithine deacetylase